MKTIWLNKRDYIPAKTGANITFHLIKWDDSSDTFRLKAGGNINYHSLSSNTTTIHTHEFPEIFLVMSGKIRHHINSESEELTGGTLVFIRPSDAHCFEQCEYASCELVNFAFQLEFLLDLSKYLEDDFFLRRFTAPVIPPTFKLSVDETDKIGFDLLKINNASQVNMIGETRIRIKTVIAELFTTYFLEKRSYFSNPGVPDWLVDLCTAMKKKKNFVKGLQTMYKLAPCTPEHLCKAFRQYLNKTPTEFINELRINHSARQLADSNEEIYAIATDLGFQSLSRFYHLFNRYYDISPSKYRKLSRRNDIPI